LAAEELKEVSVPEALLGEGAVGIQCEVRWEELAGDNSGPMGYAKNLGSFRKCQSNFYLSQGMEG
jgi:hypothetical protein